MSFSFIDDKNKILDIDSSQNYYLAGKNKEILFISKTFNISDGIITFDVDTYTEPFLNEIKKRNTEIQIELGYNTSGIQKVLLRDYAFAQPRVYIEGLNPSKVDLADYYTKGEVDELIKNVDVPTKVSELENDVGYITGYTETDPVFSSVSGTLATKTYVDKAIPDISDMIKVSAGRFLDVGSFNSDGITPKFDTSVIGTDINIIGANIVYIFGSSLNFCNFENGHPFLTVSSSEFKYKSDYDIERMKRANANSFTFESYAYLTLTSPITSINYSLPNGTLNNAVLQFTTGDTVEFTITGSSSYKINKPFKFEPNTSYIIYVDVYDIFWCKLHNFNQ